MRHLLCLLVLIATLRGHLADPKKTAADDIVNSSESSHQYEDYPVICPEFAEKISNEILEELGYKVADTQSSKANDFFDIKKPLSTTFFFEKLLAAVPDLKENFVKYLQSKGKPTGTINEIIKGVEELFPMVKKRSAKPVPPLDSEILRKITPEVLTELGFKGDFKNRNETDTFFASKAPQSFVILATKYFAADPSFRPKLTAWLKKQGKKADTIVEIVKAALELGVYKGNKKRSVEEAVPIVASEVMSKIYTGILKDLGFTGSDFQSAAAKSFFDSKQPQSTILLFEKAFATVPNLKERFVKYLKAKGKPTGTIQEIVKGIEELFPMV